MHTVNETTTDQPRISTSAPRDHLRLRQLPDYEFVRTTARPFPMGTGREAAPTPPRQPETDER